MPLGAFSDGNDLANIYKIFHFLVEICKKIHVGYKALPVKVPGAVVCAAIAGKGIVGS